MITLELRKDKEAFTVQLPKSTTFGKLHQDAVEYIQEGYRIFLNCPGWLPVDKTKKASYDRAVSPVVRLIPR